jgi:hypothetical protein
VPISVKRQQERFLAANNVPVKCWPTVALEGGHPASLSGLNEGALQSIFLHSVIIAFPDVFATDGGSIPCLFCFYAQGVSLRRDSIRGLQERLCKTAFEPSPKRKRSAEKLVLLFLVTAR